MLQRKLAWDEILGIILFLVAACLLAVSVFLCFSDDIWYDELFTMGLADQSFGELISITARDVHPPLYYMIVKLFLTIARMLGMDVKNVPAAAWDLSGAGIYVPVAMAKLVSVLPFFLCLLYGITKVRRHFGLLSAGLFSFLLLSMPGLGGYTVEARMYGWGLFFVTAGMLHAYELTLDEAGGPDAAGGHGRRDILNWAALFLYALAACYTHYFACVGAVMVYGYLFFALLKKNRLKEAGKFYFLSGGLCALGYLPWIFGAVGLQVGQVKENYWIQPVTWRTLGGCVKFLFQPAFSNEKLNVILAVVLFMAYAGLVGMICAGNIKRRTRLPGESERCGSKMGDRDFLVAGCVGVLSGIVIFGFAASLLLRPIFVYRYMLPALGLFWLAFALSLSGWKEKKAVFFPVFLLFLAVGLRNYRAFYGEEMWKRLQMENTRKALSQVREEDAVVFNFDQAQGVASFYLPNETWLWYGTPEELITEMYPQDHPLVEGEFSDEAGIRALKNLLEGHERVWFCGSGNAREEIIQKWENAGIEATQQGSVMLERYWFNLYELKYSPVE